MKERDDLRAQLADIETAISYSPVRSCCPSVVYHVEHVVRKLSAATVALAKISAIRDSIISLQTINWSEHIYPLVAALESAGVKGKPYPADREYLGSIIAQLAAAEAEVKRLAEKSSLKPISRMIWVGGIAQKNSSLRSPPLKRGSGGCGRRWSVSQDADGIAVRGSIYRGFGPASRPSPRRCPMSSHCPGCCGAEIYKDLLGMRYARLCGGFPYDRPVAPEVDAVVEAARGLIRYVKENHPEWIGTRKDWYKQIDDALAALDRAQRKP